MQSLEQMISEWRVTMRRRLDADSVEELEGHLREAVADQVKSGKSVDEAFQAAAQRLGTSEVIEGEFRKVAFADWWAVKVSLFAAAGVVVLAALAWVRYSDRQFGLWLGPHVAAVTIGFIATYLAGGLGMAYVLERCFSDFNGGRVRAAARVAAMYSGVAAVLTGIAIVLGMMWAKLAWGRYWAWDPKEVGAFGALIWQILFYILGRAELLPAKAVMLLAIVGNVVMSFGWLAPNGSYSILITLLALHAPFLALGFAPSGWFHRRSEAGSR